MKDLHSLELTIQMPVVQMPVGGATDCGPNTGGGTSWMCGQHNARATAKDNTGQNTDKGHTPSLRIEIKISDTVGNRIRAAGIGNSTELPRRREKQFPSQPMYQFVSFPWPPQWSRGNIVASHIAGPGSISGGVSFPGWGSFLGFSSTVRQMSRKFRPYSSPDFIGHHNLFIRPQMTFDVDAS